MLTAFARRCRSRVCAGVSGTQRRPKPAWDSAGGGFAISWIGAATDVAALRLGTLDAQGKLLRVREVVAIAPGRSTGHPRMVWYRDAHYLTWTEALGSGQTRIALARIAP